jgi:hypothetical protein
VPVAPSHDGRRSIADLVAGPGSDLTTYTMQAFLAQLARRECFWATASALEGGATSLSGQASAQRRLVSFHCAL